VSRVAGDPRLSVCLTFDFDATSVWIVDTDNPAAVSRGEFGPVAIPRILALLDQHGAQATFFVPGHTALAYGDQVRAIRDAGHEIGHHGWVHENPAAFDPAGERENFARGLDALDRVAGVRPRGYRSPAGQFSASTIEILLENEMLFDSSCGGSDFSPYYLRLGDRFSKTEPYEFGEPADLVELPFSWLLDDFPHLEFDAGWSTEQSPPSVVREIWQAEFDYAHAHADGGVFGLCMHPQVIGRGSRLMMLDGLLEHMAAQPGVVFESCGAYAERWRAAHPLGEWRRTPSVHAPRPSA
jgi:peptidoglycan/xylan/chitin deacetylase (PgdA/CDA1 family)